ncbi:MAG: redoxin domain-containing protein [Acidimicrobiia bacterium]|nr:redoxin domain-containing protein [Acidimicrobiia bacterium]
MLVGSPAPAFELLDQDKNPVSLESLKGSKTLIVFIPFPFTGICDDEGCALRDNLNALSGLDAKVVIITVHAVPVAKKWADEYGFDFPVLSDYWPHGATAMAYGAFNDDRGAANRYSFVLDADGVVREVINTESLGIAREMDAYTAALAKV